MTTKATSETVLADMIAELEGELRPLENKIRPLRIKIGCLKEVQDRFAATAGTLEPDVSVPEIRVTRKETPDVKSKVGSGFRKKKEPRRYRRSVEDGPTQREFVLSLLSQEALSSGLQIKSITARVNSSGNGWAPSSISATMSTMKGKGLVWVDGNDFYKLTEAGISQAREVSYTVSRADPIAEPAKELPPVTAAAPTLDRIQPAPRANW